MNQKNIDKLFKEIKAGDLFYIKEIAFMKYINIANFPDTIIPFKNILAFVTKIEDEKIFLFSYENEIYEFSKQDLYDYNLLEKL